MNVHLSALEAALSDAQNALAELIDDVEADDQDAWPLAVVLSTLELAVQQLHDATAAERE